MPSSPKEHKPLAEGKLQSKELGHYNLTLSQISEVELPPWRRLLAD